MIRKKLGFTLIELLVVLVLIAIIASFSVLAFTVSDHFQQAKNTARRLADVMSLAQQQAMLQPAVLGLLVNAQGYQVFRYENVAGSGQYHWQALAQEQPIFAYTVLPKKIRVQVSGVLSASSAVPITMPQIFFYSDGEVTPFILNIATTEGIARYQLRGTADGTITQVQLPRPS